MAQRSFQILQEKLKELKYNPAAIQDTLLDQIEEVDIVDPTNPFMFMLSSLCLSHASLSSEMEILHRKKFAKLSQTTDELHHHMSDLDYLGRFALPSSTKFHIAIPVDDIYTKLVRDPIENCFKAIIPGNTEFGVDGYKFSIQYPIVIRKYDNEVVELSWLIDKLSPLKTLSSNLIDYTVRRDVNTNRLWISFDVEVDQFYTVSTSFTVNKSKGFDENIVLDDQFYHVRIFQRNSNTSNKWKEIYTTHSDLVYDPTKPTACLRVTENVLNIKVPIVYTYNDLIKGELRVDVYCTKGAMSLDLSTYRPASFNYELKELDTDDLDDYRSVIRNIEMIAYSTNIVSGGSNGISFEELRQRTVNNSNGDRNLPITDVQLADNFENRGFSLVEQVDSLTSLIYLATKKLPAPSNPRLLTAANIGMSTITLNNETLTDHSRIYNNTNRITIGSGSIFKQDNSILKLLTDSELAVINSLPEVEKTLHLNSNKYFYNPFYYCIDGSSDELDLRAYHLDQPLASSLGFIGQNVTVQLPMNTKNYRLYKTINGYRFDLETKSGNFYKLTPDSSVFAQLAFKPKGQDQLAFINSAYLDKTADDERLYGFDILTNHDIDSDDNIIITNATYANGLSIPISVYLNTEFYIVYSTNSISANYQPSELNDYVGISIIDPSAVAITVDRVNFRLGYSLKNLWRRCRPLLTEPIYQRYPTDVMMTYPQTVYKINEDTKSIFKLDSNGHILLDSNNRPVYDILHNQGDVVLDNAGNTVYLHRAGDVVTINGIPVIQSNTSSLNELDIFLVDGKYYFTTDENFVSYRDEITKVITDWIIDDIEAIKKMALTKTKVYFYPKNTAGYVKIKLDNELTSNIESEQSFNVTVYLSSNIYRDMTARSGIKSKIVKILDEYLDDKEFNIVELNKRIKETLGDSIRGFTVSGLGDNKDIYYAKLFDDQNRLSLKKNIVLQTDGKTYIEEDVNVEFRRID